MIIIIDLLWSDPICEEEMENMTLEEYQSFIELEWKPNSSRGCSYLFGYKVVKEFLEVNNFVCIIRAHEVQEDGFRRHFDPKKLQEKIKMLLESWCQTMSIFKGETPETLMNVISLPYSFKYQIPPMLTIFSAPNYCDRYENKGAILLIDKELDGFRLIQYECVEHPAGSIEGNQTENSIIAIIATCPYMPSSFKMFVKYAVELVPEESTIFDADSNDNDDDSFRVPSTDEESSISPNRSMKTSSSGKRSMSITIPLNSKENDVKQVSPTYSTPKHVKDLNHRKRISGFEQALASDAINELHPELSPMGKEVIMMTKVVEATSPLRSLSIRTDELQAVGVQELRKRFENGNLGSSSLDSISSSNNLGSSSNDTITPSSISDHVSISSTRFAEIRKQFEKAGTFITFIYYYHNNHFIIIRTKYIVL
jgi:diadenosine tetraphosphatase ApaH/serine/threonine PP2A family protein phosphatase